MSQVDFDFENEGSRSMRAPNNLNISNDQGFDFF